MKPVTFPAGIVTVETLDGSTFRGSTADEIVDSMRFRCWSADGATREAYREGAAARALLWIKQPVRFDTSESLLLDLAAIGLIVIRRGAH
jgi:hypothetical protein